MTAPRPIAEAATDAGPVPGYPRGMPIPYRGGATTFPNAAFADPGVGSVNMNMPAAAPSSMREKLLASGAAPRNAA